MPENKRSFMEMLLLEAENIFEPLIKINNYGETVDFVENLGYKLPDIDPGSVQSAIDRVITEIKVLPGLVSAYQDSDYIPIINKINDVIELINDFKNVLNNLTSQDIDNENLIDAQNNIPRRLLDFLVATYTEREYSVTNSLFSFLNIFISQQKDVKNIISNTLAAPSTVDIRIIDWNNLKEFIIDPISYIVNIYCSDSVNEFNSDIFLERFDSILESLCIPGGIYEQGIKLKENLGNTSNLPYKEIRMPLLQGGGWGGSDLYYEAGIHFAPVDAMGELKKGLAIISYLVGAAKIEPSWSETFDISLTFDGEINGLGIIIRPGSQVEIFKNLFPPSDTQPSDTPPSDTPTKDLLASLDFKLEIKQKQNIEDNEILILGSKEASYFSINKFSFILTIKYEDNKEDYCAELKIGEINITINPSQGDGFLKKVLPNEPLTLKGDLTLGYSKNKGFYFGGGAGFDYTIQINKDIGPIFISTVDLNLYINDEGIILNSTVSGGATIGPVSAVIEKIGLKSELEFNKPGILGNADLTFGFKSPSGIGVSIDAGVIKGGGFLSVEKPNYMGIAYLSIQDKIELTAFGILTTELPDGKDGYSLIFSILAKFTPMQLGFGFALNGVGGIVGIHRCMMEEPLRQVIKNHSLDTILFPKNPITDAVQILNAIQEIFPPKEDYYVFGVMVNIIWGGVIELVNFSLGVIIEIGGGGKLAILGLAKAALPDPKTPLIVINMDILGFIDFSASTLKIDSSIFDSRILAFNLSGDMALRACWGDSPDFAMSLGGFHPRFNPPTGFPALQRLMLSIGEGDFRLGLSTYLAITTNSIQFGALLELYIKYGKFLITGGGGFDALFIFKPFSFDIGVFVWLKIAYRGSNILSMSIDMILTGPNPFRARGKVEFSLLFIDVTVPFDKTFGDTQQEEITIVSPCEELKEQLKDSRNLIYILPDWAGDGIIFAPEAEKKLDPLGAIRISQNAVPLKTEIDVYAGSQINGPEKYFEIIPVDDSLILTDTTDSFAPAQFINMTNDEKLVSKPFEKMPSGIILSGTYTNDLIDLSYEMDYETIVCDYQKPPWTLLTDGNELLADKEIANKVDLNGISYGSDLWHNSNNISAAKILTHYIKVEEPQFSTIDIDGKREDHSTFTNAFIKMKKSRANKPEIINSSVQNLKK